MGKRKITFTWLENPSIWEIREMLGLYAYRVCGWIGMEQNGWRITYYFGPNEPMSKDWFSHSNCLAAFDEAEYCILNHT